MIEIQVTNRIREQVEKYQEKTGTSKTWVAKQLGISNQRLYQLFDAKEISLTNIAKLCVLLDCHYDDLFEIKATNK